MPIGAPPFPWTTEIEQEIFNRMMAGEAVAHICGVDRDDFLPSEKTFYKRLTQDDAFAQAYARARETQAHREADEIREIADSATAENYNVSRLRVDARKWRAAKLAPKKYGDKVDLTSGGEALPAPQIITRTVIDPKGDADA